MFQQHLEPFFCFSHTQNIQIFGHECKRPNKTLSVMKNEVI